MIRPGAALLLAALVLGACTPFEPPVGVPELPASIVATTPADQDDEVAGTTVLSIEWDRVPVAVTMSLSSFGADVPGTVQGSDTEVLRRFVTDEPLRPDANYTLDVAWSTGEGRISFHTNLMGFPLDEDELDLLEGQTFFIDPQVLFDLGTPVPGLPDAPDVGFLLAVHESSRLDDGELHLLLAETVTASQLQNQCAETAVITAGPDRVRGTGDDTPGTWNNPVIEAAGALFAPGSGTPYDGTTNLGANLTLRDWTLRATVIPEEEGLFIHRFTALLDTAFLDALIPQSKALPEDSTFCSLMERFGNGRCVPCPSLSRESRCLEIEALDLLAESRRANLRERTCEDIIGSARTGIICDGADERYDEDGDGIYELCPAWTPPGG